jgi:hypothetical protein
MKNSFLFVALFLSVNLSAQKEYPSSFLDVGIGAGTNFGMLGAQAVAGKNGSGFLAAIGTLFGMPAWQLGLQLNSDWFFVSGSYGTYTIVKDEAAGKYSSIQGFIVLTGARIKFLKSKKFFFEIGLGWAGGGSFNSSAGSESVQGLSGTAGIGYRIGKKK